MAHGIHRAPPRVGILILALATMFAGVACAGASSPPAPRYSCRGWRDFRAPSPGNDGAKLSSIAALSFSDAWAVGSFDTVPSGSSPPPNPGAGPGPPKTTHTLVEHWDGSRWRVVPSPSPGSRGLIGGSWLNGVAAVASDDAWAVGGSANSETGLIEHWDGTRWTIVKSPVANLVDASLLAVSASSANDAWAIGTSYANVDGAAPAYPLVEHRNGTAWELVSVPLRGRGAGLALTGTGPHDIWVLAGMGATFRGVMVHFDGRRWGQSASPRRHPAG